MKSTCFVGSSVPDHSAYLRSTPENGRWSWFPIAEEPVFRMQSGETVRVNTQNPYASDPE